LLGVQVEDVLCEEGGKVFGLHFGVGVITGIGLRVLED
jgi:hypothetical protein